MGYVNVSQILKKFSTGANDVFILMYRYGINTFLVKFQTLLKDFATVRNCEKVVFYGNTERYLDK